MFEVPRQLPETRLSPEQESLIATARQLLQSPKATEGRPSYTYRFTTVREKAQRVLGRMVGIRHEPVSLFDNFFETPKTETRTRTVGLRGLGGWGEGIYLRQTTTTDLDTGASAKELVMYAIENRDDEPADADDGTWYEQMTWCQNLLEPIDNPLVLEQLQAELNEALWAHRPRV